LSLLKADLFPPDPKIYFYPEGAEQVTPRTSLGKALIDFFASFRFAISLFNIQSITPIFGFIAINLIF
jgi:hypothetical protein